MGRYLAQRVLRWLPSVGLLLFAVYALAFYGAGDPVRLMFLREGGDVTYDEERLAAIREALGLNRPFLVQFGDYVGHLVRGDLGVSVTTGRDVVDMLRTTAPVSFQLGLAAVALLAVIGIPLGVVAALNQNTWIDNCIVALALFAAGIPAYVAGPILLVVLVIGLDVMEVPRGWHGLFSQATILPLAVLIFNPLSIVIRQTRSAVLEVLGEDYVRTARAKGLPEHVVVGRHILRPVLTPVITALGQILIGIVNGAIIVETIFGVPGLGRLTLDFTRGVDYPVILAITLIGSFLVMGANLLVDLIYPVLDPRAREAMTPMED